MIQNLENILKTAFGRFFYGLPLTFTAGGLSALAMAPYNVWVIFLLTLPTLYAAIHSAPSKKAAFGYGWGFGFGYFVFSLSWIGNALLVEDNPYAWAWPLAVCGLPFILAFFTAFAALTIKAVCKLDSCQGFLGFIGIFAIFEFLRGHLFTGFPWNLFAYTWVDTPQMTQILFWSDAYTLTLLTLLWLSAPALLLIQSKTAKTVLYAIIIFSISLNFAYGHWRISQPLEKDASVNFKIIQPNIAQHEKWKPNKMVSHFAKLTNMSYSTKDETSHTYIIWPETAIIYWMLNDPGMHGALKAMLNSYDSGATLMTGLLNKDPITKNLGNSIITMEQSGVISSLYNKHHLVPFGEYIPLQDFIPLETITRFSGFERGQGLETLKTKAGHSFSPLVCYEILFPNRSIDETNRPDFIINVTNDAWYGDSAGPRQHLAKAQYRAIENGITVIRAANTGISAIISPYGLVTQRGKLLSEAKLSYPLIKTSKKIAPSVFLKNIVFLGLCVIFIGVAITQRIQRT